MRGSHVLPLSLKVARKCGGHDHDEFVFSAWYPINADDASICFYYKEKNRPIRGPADQR